MVTKEMLVSDILDKNESLAEVLFEAGMGCLHCVLANSETLEEACLAHGIDVDEVVKTMNEMESK